MITSPHGELIGWVTDAGPVLLEDMTREELLAVLQRIAYERASAREHETRVRAAIAAWAVRA